MTSDPMLGRILMGKYLLRAKIGEGGFGVVYEAERLQFASKVAIKVLRTGAINAEGIARFRREALATSRLTHPYAVKVYDRGETEEGFLWLAMEFLEGRTLETCIQEQGTLEEREVVKILGPVCEVLEEAHQKGIVHRDLTSQNIMLTPLPGGREAPRVFDFGLMGLYGDEPLTSSSMMGGTPRYMAPEQWEGLKNADARSDIYALGIIAYQCLTGRFPFEANTLLEWMSKHYHTEPDNIRLSAGRPLSEAVANAVMKAISKRPEDRHQRAIELKRALEATLR